MSSRPRCLCARRQHAPLAPGATFVDRRGAERVLAVYPQRRRLSVDAEARRRLSVFEEGWAMLFAVSGLMGCPVEASDGEVGAVKDFLFDDQTWKIRWMAVEAGDWLPGRRRVFIHPSAIAPLQISPKPSLPMMSSPAPLQLTVNLARAQIEAGPHAHEDDPVTTDMQA